VIPVISSPNLLLRGGLRATPMYWYWDQGMLYYTACIMVSGSGASSLKLKIFVLSNLILTVPAWYRSQPNQMDFR
jgi:hypothetical protein